MWVGILLAATSIWYYFDRLRPKLKANKPDAVCIYSLSYFIGVALFYLLVLWPTLAVILDYDADDATVEAAAKTTTEN